MVKIGIRNFLIIGIMAILFIVMMKVVTAKYPVPGISNVVQAV